MKKPPKGSGPAAMLARRGEWTVTAAAREIGRSPDTVRRWISEGRVEPRRVACGDKDVAVFNADELEGLRRLSKSVKGGRPPVGLRPMRRTSE